MHTLQTPKSRIPNYSKLQATPQQIGIWELKSYLFGVRLGFGNDQLVIVNQ